jgi:hypothetical protein
MLVARRLLAVRDDFIVRQKVRRSTCSSRDEPRVAGIEDLHPAQHLPDFTSMCLSLIFTPCKR